MFKNVMGIIGAMVLVLAIVWGLQGNDFFMYKFFAPKYEQARRQVFEQTKSYNQGYIQELQAMQFEYVKADDKQKAALSSIILHRMADYDENKLTPDLRTFVAQLKSERSR